MAVNEARLSKQTKNFHNIREIKGRKNFERRGQDDGTNFLPDMNRTGITSAENHCMEKVFRDMRNIFYVVLISNTPTFDVYFVSF